MRRVVPAWLALCAFFSIGAAAGASAQTAQPQASPTATDPALPTDATTQETLSSVLFARMQKLNANLKTYKAELHLDVTMHTFPFLSSALDGNVFFKQPGSQAVVFEVVPALASQFKKLYAHLDPPATWASLYTLETLGDDGQVTTLRLVPRKRGRVSYLDVAVDDGTATITNYRWNYTDGGFIAFAQTFTTINGNYLVNAQSGHVELPSYKADVKSTLSHYQLNVPIDAAVFNQDN
jgi:outer membrane lipoprotein-sorting protein